MHSSLTVIEHSGRTECVASWLYSCCLRNLSSVLTSCRLQRKGVDDNGLQQERDRCKSLEAQVCILFYVLLLSTSETSGECLYVMIVSIKLGSIHFGGLTLCQ